MIRKGNISYKSDQYHESNIPLRIPKTPIVRLERLNIPLDSEILIKGSSIICQLDSHPKIQNQVRHVKTTINDDDISEDTNFREITIRRFQSTRDPSALNKSERFSGSDSEFTVTPTSQVSIAPITITNERTVFESENKEQPLKKNIMSMSNVSGRVRELVAHKKQILMRKRMLDSTRNTDTTDNIGHCITEDVPFNISRSSGIASNTQKGSPHGKMLSNKSIIGQTSFSEKNESETEQNNDDSIETPDTDEIMDKTIENRGDFIPNRMSERIKNKKVKFSVLKLLAGGKIRNSKRDQHLPNNKKRPTQRRSYIKTNASVTAGSFNDGLSRLSTNSEHLYTFSEQEGSEVTKESTTSVTLKKDSSPFVKKVNLSKDNVQNDVYNAINAALNEIKQKLDETQFIEMENRVSVNRSKHSEDNDAERSSLERVLEQKEGNNNINTDDSVSNFLKSKSTSPKETNFNGRKEISKSPTPFKEQIGAIKKVSNKIKLQLQGTPERKVINISISPFKKVSKGQSSLREEIKHKLDVGLGPDIIIKRVKSDKKQVSNESFNTEKNTENNSSTLGNSGKIQEVDNGKNATQGNPVIAPGNLIVRNRLYPETVSRSGVNATKEVEVPPQIKKLMFESNKNKKPITFKPSDSLMSKINSIANKSVSNDEGSEALAKKRKKGLIEFNRKKRGTKRKDDMYYSGGDDDLSDADMASENNDLDTSDIQVIDDDSLKDTNHLNREAKIGENTKNINSFPTDVNRVVGKKTAKVTPLRQVNKVQPTNEIMKKNYNEKLRTIEEKEFSKFPKTRIGTQLRSSPEVSIIGERKYYKNSFEKYFICNEKIYEHNDSMDSDSDGGTGNEVYLLSHFIDLKRSARENKETNDTENLSDRIENSNIDSTNVDENQYNNQDYINSNNDNSTTVKKLIKDISSELPHWNWHILPDTSVVCFILLEKQENGVDVKKCIEIDNFKANVYINKEIVSEYSGVYESLDAIKNLIYQVDLL